MKTGWIQMKQIHGWLGLFDEAGQSLAWWPGTDRAQVMALHAFKIAWCAGVVKEHE